MELQSKTTKRTMITVVLAVVFAGMLLVNIANSASTFDGSRHRRGFNFFKLLKDLNLTPDQETDIANILKQNRDALKDAATTARADKKAVFAAIHGAEYNEQAVRDAYRQASQSGEELAVLRARVFHEVRAILTPEQLETLEKMQAEHRAKMKDRMEHKIGHLDEWIDAHAQ